MAETERLLSHTKQKLMRMLAEASASNADADVDVASASDSGSGRAGLAPRPPRVDFSQSLPVPSAPKATLLHAAAFSASAPELSASLAAAAGRARLEPPPPPASPEGRPSRRAGAGARAVRTKRQSGCLVFVASSLRRSVPRVRRGPRVLDCRAATHGGGEPPPGGGGGGRGCCYRGCYGGVPAGLSAERGEAALATVRVWEGLPEG
eukprot:519631-Prorocentrum_minimum.AAC.1